MTWLCLNCHDTGHSVIAVGTLCGNPYCEAGKLAIARSRVNPSLTPSALVKKETA